MQAQHARRRVLPQPIRQSSKKQKAQNIHRNPRVTNVKAPGPDAIDAGFDTMGIFVLDQLETYASVFLVLIGLEASDMAASLPGTRRHREYPRSH